MKTEPNKLEEQFRQKLEQRTIQPSEMAWDRLDAMLSVAEKKKPKRTWMYMAASFLVFVTLGALFLTRGGDADAGTATEQNVVVTEETATPTEAIETLPVKQNVPAPEQVILQNNEQLAAKQPGTTRLRPSVKAVQQRPVNVQSPVNETAVAERTEPSVVAQDEAEQLVAEAATQETTKKKSTLKVDAGSLLSSVEGELDESFREKAYKGVLKNFNVVKTAVVNRNYQ